MIAAFALKVYFLAVDAATVSENDQFKAVFVAGLGWMLLTNCSTRAETPRDGLEPTRAYLQMVSTAPANTI